MRKLMPEFFAALHGKDPVDDRFYLRIMLRVSEQQTSSEKFELIERLEGIADSHFDDTQVTGYFVLLSQLIDSVLRDQWKAFATAVMGIGILMYIAFRDLRMALIALVPNSLPILVVIGMMGWLRVLIYPDLKINIGAAMIAAVSMGLSIDSSIHYIISFQRARLKKDLVDALMQVQQNVGRAMVLSTLSLIVGFTVLATSQFVPTIYFGSLGQSSDARRFARQPDHLTRVVVSILSRQMTGDRPKLDWACCGEEIQMNKLFLNIC